LEGTALTKNGGQEERGLCLVWAAVSLGLVFAALVPLALITIGVSAARRDLWARDHCLRVEGTILGETCGDASCAKEIAFRDERGVSHLTTRESTSIEHGAPGSRISICFVPGRDPPEIYFSGDENSGYSAVLIGILMVASYVKFFNTGRAMETATR
jgi:hypothetical protein